GAGSASVKLSAIGSVESARLSSHANAGVTIGGLTNELNYAGAVALAATQRGTLITEAAGRFLMHGSEPVTVTAPHPTLRGVQTIRLSAGSAYVNLITFSPGVKWNVSDTWVLSANVTMPLTRDGLTSRFTPFVGLDYAYTVDR